jgi:hypothetical protein
MFLTGENRPAFEQKEPMEMAWIPTEPTKEENETPRSKLRGIKVEMRRSPYPPSLYRASARFTLPFIPAAPSKRNFRFAPTSLQGIQAKANKMLRLTATDFYTYFRPSKSELRIYLKTIGILEGPPVGYSGRP